jgi:hypothetical protein
MAPLTLKQARKAARAAHIHLFLQGWKIPHICIDEAANLGVKVSEAGLSQDGITDAMLQIFYKHAPAELLKP